jgi:uncharacterized protein
MPRHRLRAGFAGLATAAFVLAGAPTAYAADFPAPTGYLVDDANAIPEPAEQVLEAELEAYAERSGHQLAVAVVDSTDDESIEDYANDLFGEWGVGSAERDDGVLIVVAIDDRELRIEVGRGLEATLTDIEAADIIRDDMVPKLKVGDYAGAVRAGERGVRGVLGDPTPNAGGRADASAFDGYGGGEPAVQQSQTGYNFAPVMVIIIFVVIMLASFGNRRRRGRNGGFFPIFIGSGWGGGGWSGGGGGGFGGFGGGGFGGGGAGGDV